MAGFIVHQYKYKSIIVFCSPESTNELDEMLNSGWQIIHSEQFTVAGGICYTLKSVIRK